MAAAAAHLLLAIAAAPLRPAPRAALQRARPAACAPAAEPTVGAAIERARSAEELLAAAARIPSPGPPFAPPFLADDVHQRRRQRLACNALQRLAGALVGSGNAAERQAALLDERLGHLAGCAATPSCGRADGADPAADAATAREVAGSLAALATLCGEDAVERSRAGEPPPALARLRGAALALGGRAEALSGHLLVPECASARHSLRRLVGGALLTPALDARVAHLPFDVLFAAVALPPAEGAARGARGQLAELALRGGLSLAELRAHVPFAQSELLTADGRRVRERRHTAWLCEAGIGALAYSGKLMAPQAMGPAVAAVRDALAADSGQAFDCALCNMYPPGGEAACKWHTDPEHGSRWDLPTTVVAVGEPRRFAFRPVRGGAADEAGGGAWPHVLHLFAGDAVQMVGACNDEYEHAVLPGEGPRNVGARISLVFKRALLCNGRKGHGLAGEGRRARARRRQAEEEGGPARSDPQPRGPVAAARPPRGERGGSQRRRADATASGTGAVRRRS